MELAPARNVILGPNGAGKTSLLESVFLLGRGRSFRTRQTRRLVQSGRQSFSVFGETRHGERLEHRIGVGFQEGVLQIRIDDAPARGMAQLADALVVHVIDPSAHELIEGGPSIRRRFLDAGVFHVEHGYLEVWRNYRRVLGQRNAALKSGACGAALKVWSEPLIEAAGAIDDARSQYIARLAERVKDIGLRLLNAEISLQYRSGWRQGIEFAVALAESEARDRETGFTQLGPHRADVGIRMHGALVREQASRGQQKLVASACVLAEVAELESRSERTRNVLLIDDPAAELDAEALERLLAELEDIPVQQLITAIGSAAIPHSNARVFHVEQGAVKAVV